MSRNAQNVRSDDAPLRRVKAKKRLADSEQYSCGHKHVTEAKHTVCMVKRQNRA